MSFEFINFAELLVKENSLLKVHNIDMETPSFYIHCGTTEAIILKEAMWAMGFGARFELIGLCHYKVIEDLS